MYLINKHLLNATIGPFFFGLFVITFLLMIDVLFRYVDLFVSKGVSFVLATKFLVLSLGHTVALSVPMAVLISVLMGVGQLAADQEITALKASGISLLSVLRPLLLMALLITVGQVAYNHYIFPESNHTLATLLYDINRKKPMLEIREQQFTEMSDKMTIFVSTKNDITGRIEDVTIFEKEKPSDLSPRMTVALWGRIVPDHASDSMLIELYDGEIHERPDRENPDKYQVIRFGQHNIHVDNVERDFQSSDRQTRSDREMNLSDLWTAAQREQGKQDEVLTHVDDLHSNFLTWQWRLLDPQKRYSLLGKRAAPASDKERQSFLAGKFKATRTKVKRAVEQSKYQDKILQSYQVKKNRYLVELHKKFSIPFACVVFVLLGVPMAVTSSRSGKGVSVTMAIVVYLVYYLFLVGGEKMADRGLLDPLWSMWAPNIVLLVVGIPLFAKAMRESTLLSITLRPKAVVDSTTIPGETV